MLKNWTIGLLRARGFSLAAAAIGVATAVSLLALLGLFVSQGTATMTARAVAAVGPDWQVQLVDIADPASVDAAIRQTASGSTIEVVNYADIAGLSASTASTVQTTGVGKAVGVDATYREAFPAQIRLLAGSLDGPLLAQQTAANLRAAPGDQVTIRRLASPPVTVTIAGIVEMPNADQFFQIVGQGRQATPTAPPDNVILLPQHLWQEYFGDQLAAMPQTAQRHMHVGIDHGSLPTDPVVAYVQATSMANKLSAKLAGDGMIANNLAARLDGVRQDALFAKVLFMFLGVPGAIVAILLAMLIVLSGADRRRREIALLQLRGARPTQTLAFVGLEALLVGAAGAIAGLVVAWILARSVLALPAGMAQSGWFAAAAACGLIAALCIFMTPSWEAMHRSVSQKLAPPDGDPVTIPAWKRLWLDVGILGIAAAVFWESAATGYQVVTAPEGVATATVDYKAYVAPGLLWIGLGLLLMRLWEQFMRRGKPVLRVLLLPTARNLTTIVTASLSRDRQRVTKGVVLVALAFSFATSTAIFNSTYENQANIDASLTNGADVTVSGSTQAPPSAILPKISNISGVHWAEPMQHRFAYVGTDLQDLYGINPATIGNATSISNAYFTSNDAAATLSSLQTTPDGLLVSDETVTDFQLRTGDTLNLRLQNASVHAYHTVPFTFIGVVREFPAAPTDSFLIANASYVAKATGNASAETILVRADQPPPVVAARIRAALDTTAGFKVTDISEAAHRIGSSLVAINLRALTTLELVFALPVIAGAVGLVFALGLEERRRNFAILLAVGAKAGHLGAFLWSEAIIVYAVGMAAGQLIGTVLAWVLIKMMTQVFDPPPDALAVPWGYLMLLAGAGLVAVVVSVFLQLRQRSEPLSFAIRKL
jgi:putative ABC transport system permease protein